LFLGGWRAPWPISVWSTANTGWWPLLWFLAKVLGFIFVFFWLRASLPRIRYDQLMKLGWKVLIPSALVWTLIVATARVYRRQGASPAVYVIGGGIFLVLLILLWRWESGAERAERIAKEAADERAMHAGEAPQAAPFPTPPLDLPHYHGIGAASPGESVLAGVTGDDTKEVPGA
jgi:NADH-quinone oxidoreductase subunit H